MNKFKPGDRVMTDRGIKGRVSKIKNNIIYIVSDHGTELGYEEKELRFYYPHLEEKSKLNMEHVGDKCPRCRTPWTITRWGVNAWYHCEKCKKKAVDLILGSSTPPPIPGKRGEPDEKALRELEQLLSSFSDDDFDDWF